MCKKHKVNIANSDEKILQILEESNKYLEQNSDTTNKIKRALMIFYYMEDLQPQTAETGGLEGMFPLAEASHELENSIQLCKIGFYKSALAALRNVLELGLLSVYWALNERSPASRQEWMSSEKHTPYTRDIISALETDKNIKAFDDKHNFFRDVRELLELSRFVHTRGTKYSYYYLTNGALNHFKEESFLKWLGFFLKVIKMVVIVHVLKYPVAFQYTPMDQFGLNPPAGGFLEPHQSRTIKKFLDADVVKTIQEISDSDETAVAIAKWVNDQED